MRVILYLLFKRLTTDKNGEPILEFHIHYSDSPVLFLDQAHVNIFILNINEIGFLWNSFQKTTDSLNVVYICVYNFTVVSTPLFPIGPLSAYMNPDSNFRVLPENNSLWNRQLLCPLPANFHTVQVQMIRSVNSEKLSKQFGFLCNR